MKNRNAVTKQSAPRLSFLNETIGELKKVVWLSRSEVIYLTTLVLVVTITVAIVLGLIDFGFSQLVDSLFLPGK